TWGKWQMAKVNLQSASWRLVVLLTSSTNIQEPTTPMPSPNPFEIVVGNPELCFRFLEEVDTRCLQEFLTDAGPAHDTPSRYFSIAVRVRGQRSSKLSRIQKR